MGKVSHDGPLYGAKSLLLSFHADNLPMSTAVQTLFGANVPTGALLAHIAEFRPDLLGLSVSFAQQLRVARGVVTVPTGALTIPTWQSNVFNWPAGASFMVAVWRSACTSITPSSSSTMANAATSRAAIGTWRMRVASWPKAEAGLDMVAGQAGALRRRWTTSAYRRPPT